MVVYIIIFPNAKGIYYFLLINKLIVDSSGNINLIERLFF